MFPKMVLGPAAIVHGSAEGWRFLLAARFSRTCLSRAEAPRAFPGPKGGTWGTRRLWLEEREMQVLRLAPLAQDDNLSRSSLSGSSNLLGEGEGEGFEALTEREEGAQFGGEFFGRVVGAAILD
jgi:hypothetical protein